MLKLAVSLKNKDRVARREAGVKLWLGFEQAKPQICDKFRGKMFDRQFARLSPCSTFYILKTLFIPNLNRGVHELSNIVFSVNVYHGLV